jgi:isoaspartyl peptidase/L-asparaginase-like protein (Ntn-hydrolase superfamily)
MMNPEPEVLTDADEGFETDAAICDGAREPYMAVNCTRKLRPVAIVISVFWSRDATHVIGGFAAQFWYMNWMAATS